MVMPVEFANIAEFRQNVSRVFERLDRSGEIVILRNGRPVGMLVAADQSNLDALRVAVQRARSQLAIDRIRAASVRRGQERLTATAIERLVRKTRRERKLSARA